MTDDYKRDNTYIIEGSIFDYTSPAEQPGPFTPLGRFAELAKLPDDQIDLAEAALLIAAQEYPSLDENYYLERLDSLAVEIAPLISVELDPLRKIEQLNVFLKNKGFVGNQQDYYDRRNSYLNDLLERGKGIPITLSLLYIELGKRLGMHFEGIGLPGHFIVRYRELAPQLSIRNEYLYEGLERLEELEEADRASDGSILIDPFNGGAILSEEDCLDIVRQRYGRVVPLTPAFMRPVSNRQFLTRMLFNLKTSFMGEDDFERALQNQECLLMLNPNLADEQRNRGVLYLQAGRYGRAITDLREYLRANPNASDAKEVRKQLGLAFDAMSHRN